MIINLYEYIYIWLSLGLLLCYEDDKTILYIMDHNDDSVSAPISICLHTDQGKPALAILVMLLS